MKPETVDAIHDATLKARELVTTEISEQLEGHLRSAAERAVQTYC